MTSLFVSCAELDKDRVGYFCEVLETAVRGLALDAYFRSGRAMPDEFSRIEDERIRRSPAVVLAISQNWLKSRACYREYVSAMVQGDPAVIIPIQVAPVDLAQLDEFQKTTLRHIRERHGQCYDLSALSVETAFQPSPDFEVTDGEFNRDAVELVSRLAPFSIDSGQTDSFTQRIERYHAEKRKRPTIKPYNGLYPYVECDESFFFGREKEAAQALREIDIAIHAKFANVFLISGPSGAGKSSFMRAGVLPRLMQRNRDYIVLPTIDASKKKDVWLHFVERLNSPDGANLGLQKLYGDAEAPESVGTGPVRDAIASLAKRASEGTWIRRSTTGDIIGRVVVLPIDQAEDLLLEDEKAPNAERGEVARSRKKLLGLIHELSRLGPFLVIATTREASRLRLGAALAGPYVHVPFDLKAIDDEAALKSVVDQPPMFFEPPKVIEPSLWARLQRDFVQQRSEDGQGTDTILPLLAFTIERLFDHARKSPVPTISNADYEQVGTLSETLSVALQTARRSVKAAYPKLFVQDDDDLRLRHEARRLEDYDFLAEVVLNAMVTVAVDSRSFMEKRLFATDFEAREDVKAVIEALNSKDCRLVTERGEADGKYYVLAHTAIINFVREWYGPSRLILELHSAVADVKYLARDWDGAGRPDSKLGALPHQMDQISQVERNEWLNAELLGDEVLTAFVAAVREKLAREAHSQAFLEAKIKDLEHDVGVRNRRITGGRWLAGGIGVLAILAVIAVGGFIGLGEKVRTTQRLLQGGHVSDAHAHYQTIGGFQDLARSTPWLSEDVAELDARFSHLPSIADYPARVEHTRWENAALTPQVAFLSTGPRRLVAWSYRARDSASATLPTLVSIPNGVFVRPDGALLAYADARDGVLLNVASGATSSRYMQGFQQRPLQFIFSQENDLVAGAGADRRVGVWRASGQGEVVERVQLVERPFPQTVATALAFTRDGRLLAIGREQGRSTELGAPTVSVLNNSDGQIEHYISLTDTISALAFDPLGQSLIAFDESGRGCWWNMAARAHCVSLGGHQAPVSEIVFDASRPLAYSVDVNGAVVEHRLQDPGGEQRRWPLVLNSVRSVEIANDGRRLFILDRTGCVSVLDTTLTDQAVQRICDGYIEAITPWGSNGVAALQRAGDRPVHVASYGF